jgi:hypothetical protein
MAPIEFHHLVTALAAGVGMLLIGAANVVLAGSQTWRILTSVLVAIAAVTGVWAVSADVESSLIAAAILCIGILACLTAGSARLASLAAALGRCIREPVVRWGFLACAGLLTAIGSIVAYERADQAHNDAFAAELADLAAVPPCRVIGDAQVLTDSGNLIEVREAIEPRSVAELSALEDRVLNREAIRGRVIHRQPADDRSNCHGWVFTGGRCWIGGLSVDQILQDNAYEPVQEPRSGDLAVFRDGDGRVSHTAIVRYVTPGMPVMVESKWGCIGVYLHAAEASVYGTNITYHRSPRPGHLLAGAGGPSLDPVRLKSRVR